jgi:hypothetical protein
VNFLSYIIHDTASLLRLHAGLHGFAMLAVLGAVADHLLAAAVAAVLVSETERLGRRRLC